MASVFRVAVGGHRDSRGRRGLGLAGVGKNMPRVDVRFNPIAINARLKMARRKWYVGNPPKNGRILDARDGWELWDIDVVEADKWTNGETPWLNIKVLRSEANTRKGNYYLALNDERFGATRDWLLLQEHAPRAILNWLDDFRLEVVAERQANLMAAKATSKAADKAA